MTHSRAAYQDVRSDKTETNWLLVDYEVCSQQVIYLALPLTIDDLLGTRVLFPPPQSDRSDKLKLTATGSGGLEEFRAHLDETKASFGYARIRFSNDKESQREKFVLIVWIGPTCKVMRKAKVRFLCPLLPIATYDMSCSSHHALDLRSCCRREAGSSCILHRGRGA